MRQAGEAGTGEAGTGAAEPSRAHVPPTGPGAPASGSAPARASAAPPRIDEWVLPRTHVLARLGMRDVPCAGAELAVEVDVHPDLVNSGGGLQGGLIATLVDVVAGRLAKHGVPDNDVATTDLAVHYLAPLRVGPARAEGHVLRRGRGRIVLRVDVRDAGTDRLAAVSTVAYAVLTRPGS